MFTRNRILAVLVFSIAVLFSTAFIAEAQDQPKTCPMVVAESLSALGTNCANVERNTTCYGHDQVTHTAFDGDVAYTQPGQRADLSMTKTIQTGPFDLASEHWGLNVMSVDANLPYDLQPKHLVYIQMGGVEVENGVPAESAVQLLKTGVATTVSSQTSLLTWPSPSILGRASDIITTIPAGSSVSLDAINPAGDFVRAVYQNLTGWVNKNAIDASADLSTLVTIGPDSMTPMQSFYFRTGIGGTPCAEAPSLLYVQGPTNTPVDIQVFQQPVRIESTIILRSLPPGDQLGSALELTVLSGLGIVYPDTPGQILIPPGFKTTIPLCLQFQSLGTEGDADEKATCGKWSDPVPLSDNELNGCAPFAGIPDNINNYPIHCPTRTCPSGTGGAKCYLVFPDPHDLDEARRACDNQLLSADVCQYLGLT